MKFRKSVLSLLLVSMFAVLPGSVRAGGKEVASGLLSLAFGPGTGEWLVQKASFHSCCMEQLYGMIPVFGIVPRIGSMIDGFKGEDSERVNFLFAQKDLPAAPSETDQRISIVANISKAVWGIYEFTGEYKLNGKFGVTVRPAIIYSHSGLFGEDDYYGTTFNGLDLSASFRFYPWGSASRGLYVGPSAGIVSGTASVKADPIGGIEGGDEKFVLPKAGLEFGYRWVARMGLVFDLNLGYQFSIGNLPGLSDGIVGTFYNFGGNNISGLLSVGYAF